MTEQTLHWQNVHIYYYDENKDGLILDCVRPLFQRLTAVVPQAFFIRHWRQGPHLRLRFLTSKTDFVHKVKPLIDTAVSAYLSAHPSRTLLDEHKLRSVYPKLAAAEQERGDLWPLYPDNSIQYLPYDRRLHVLGSEALAAMIEDFYSDMADLTFAMVDHLRATGTSRLTLSLDLMFALAHVAGSPITRGFISYRSHADAFIMNAAAPQVLRTVFEGQYKAHASDLARRLAQVLQVLAGDADHTSVPFVQQWLAALQPYWARAGQIIAAGGYNEGLEGGITAVTNQDTMLAHSTFHRYLRADKQRLEALYHDEWFRRYRLMLNLLYLNLNQLGVRPIERFKLCHLAANTVESTFKVSAADIVSQKPVDLTCAPAAVGGKMWQIR